MSAEQNKTITRRFHELFDQGDIAGMEQLLAPNCVAHQPGMLPLSLAEFKQMGTLFATAFGESKTVLHDLVAEGDTVFTRLTWSATHQAEFNGIPATGKHVQMSEMIMNRFENGKIVEHWAQPDILGLMQQLGAIPSPQ
jgi:steroid delta-isomerase-like uncharacterized protein